MIKSVPVRLKGRPYPIYIGSGSLAQLSKYIVQHKLTGTALIVSQEPIWKAWGPTVKSQLAAAGVGTANFTAPAKLDSEKLKSYPYFLKILDTLIKAERGSRGVFIVALGGGVVGDVAGFVAAVYKRGIPFIQIPTTLTAQVDSSIGGKTAIDLPQGKNLLGAFHQPKFVLSDARALSTLPEAIYRDGLAEVVKYGVISDAKFLTWIEKNLPAILRRDEAAIEKMVTVSSRIKAKVVAGDELDTRGIRIILNYGHTIGHALEAAAGFAALSHGRAVAIGMCAAAELAVASGTLSRAEADRQKALLQAVGLPVSLSRRFAVDKVVDVMGRDKKNADGRIKVVTVDRIGHAAVGQPPLEAIAAAVEAIYA